jgi:GNAT superfamily N-acetyltransferase
VRDPQIPLAEREAEKPGTRFLRDDVKGSRHAMSESVTQGFEAAQGAVTVREAARPADVRRFVELPYTFYRQSARWVPPLRRDERRRWSPRHNAFLAHAEVALWMATVDGRPAGRIAAIDDRRHDETHGEQVTWFGFFEAESDAVAQALLGAVERHARTRGRLIVRGPVNPSLNESAGLLVHGFDREPYLLMPYNPPYYQTFVERAGYRKAKDLLAWHIDLDGPLPGRIARVADRLAGRAGFTIRPVDLGAFDRDLDALQRIYAEAWRDNWGFVVPTPAEIGQLARELRPIVDPELVLFVERCGEPVAFAVTLPDLNQVLRRMRGSLWPVGVVHFLRRRAIIDQVRMLMLGVLPEVRGLGLYPVLIAESYRRAAARGYRRAELSWTLEDNDAINAGIVAAGGRHYKTYRLYEKRL